MDNTTESIMKPSYNQTSTPNNNYALNGKIMLCSITILFTAVTLMVCFHGTACCFFKRHRRHRRAPSTSATAEAGKPSSGLNPFVVKSLPTFIYSSKTGHESTHGTFIECAVCLSAFEEGEKGRMLTSCKHRFHVECIDMWLGSHSSCPVCRAPVVIERVGFGLCSSSSVGCEKRDSELVGIIVEMLPEYHR